MRPLIADAPKLMAEERSLVLLKLPVDTQTSILAFLSHSDLHCFTRLSRGSCSVATMDRLWISLLARHFGDVDIPPHLLMLMPDRKFQALALIPCSICTTGLLPNPKETSGYSNPHSCGLCGSLCCASCHCVSHCLDAECERAREENPVLAEECSS
jgi:hypothetical protein